MRAGFPCEIVGIGNTCFQETGFAVYVCKYYILDEYTEGLCELHYCKFHYSSEHNFWANSFTTAIFWKKL